MRLPLRSSPARPLLGFTLIELLVGMVVTSIVVLGVAFAFVGVNGAYQSESQIKTAIEGSRTGVAYLERVVGMAGYGLDPRYAFDFSTANLSSLNGEKDNFVGAGFVTDDLAFRYRDPYFARRGALSPSGDRITLDPATPTWGVALRSGQAFVVLCSGATDFVVVKSTEAKSDTGTDLATSIYGDPFPAAAPSCASSGADATAPYVYLLYEVRIRVATYDGQPYLVAYYGFDDPTDANTEFAPIATGVESFQAGYVMNRPPLAGPLPVDDAGNKDWILMNDVSETDEATFLPSLNLTPDLIPTYDTKYTDLNRYNRHPTNIRAVRLSLVIRNRSDSARKLTVPRTTVENQPVWGTDDGYYRTTTSTTVLVPNLKARIPFTSPLKASGMTNDANVGGG